MSGGMSSIRTSMPSSSWTPARAAACCSAAATRSASLSAAQIQVTLASGPSAASPSVTPAIMPPPPRWPASEPSAPNW